MNVYISIQYLSQVPPHLLKLNALKNEMCIVDVAFTVESHS